MEADIHHLAATVRSTGQTLQHWLHSLYVQQMVCIPPSALSPSWGSHSSPAMFYLGRGCQEVKAWQWLICQCGCSGCWRIVALSLRVSTLKYCNNILALLWQFASEIQSFSKWSTLCLEWERCIHGTPTSCSFDCPNCPSLCFGICTMLIITIDTVQL